MKKFTLVALALLIPASIFAYDYGMRTTDMYHDKMYDNTGNTNVQRTNRMAGPEHSMVRGTDHMASRTAASATSML